MDRLELFINHEPNGKFAVRVYRGADREMDLDISCDTREEATRKAIEYLRDSLSER